MICSTYVSWSFSIVYISYTKSEINFFVRVGDFRVLAQLNFILVRVIFLLRVCGIWNYKAPVTDWHFRHLGWFFFIFSLSAIWMKITELLVALLSSPHTSPALWDSLLWDGFYLYMVSCIKLYRSTLTPCIYTAGIIMNEIRKLFSILKMMGICSTFCIGN